MKRTVSGESKRFITLLMVFALMVVSGSAKAFARQLMPDGSPAPSAGKTAYSATAGSVISESAVSETVTDENRPEEDGKKEEDCPVDVFPAFFDYDGSGTVDTADIMAYLSDNVKYPIISLQAGVSARVVVKFTITKGGSVYGVKMYKSATDGKSDEELDREITLPNGRVIFDQPSVTMREACKALDYEAMRVVANMPKWTPGKKNGQPVETRLSIPITFFLD